MTESASHAPLRDLLCSMHGSETASLPLTILVGSSLIRGDAVPRARWTSEMCAQIQVMDVGAAEGSGIDEAKTSIIEKIEESAEGAVDDGSVAYLVNAVVPPLVSLSGDQLLHLGSDAWAVSVNQIAGWTIGHGDAPPDLIA